MCTVSWCRSSGSYDLFFNRDEQKTREPALPPEVRESHGVPFITPADGNYGGTWMLVNASGITFCLLNFYSADAASPSPESPISRGHLVLSLADCLSLSDLEKRLQALNRERYRPFLILGVSPDQKARLWRWNGDQLNEDPDPEANMPFTTSSVQTESVVQDRRNRFYNLGPAEARNPKKLSAFHRTFDATHGSHSVCMRRPDAQTVSLNHIAVNSEKVSFSYCARIGELEAFGSCTTATIDRRK